MNPIRNQQTLPTHADPNVVPARMIALLGGLILLSLVLAATARLTGVGATRIAEPVGGIHVDLRFEDLPGGGIRVVDVAAVLPPQVIPPASDGFVRVALRSLARERPAVGASADTPFRLGRLDNGRLWLRDLATGRLLYLDAYGADNAKSFGKLIATANGNPGS
jgi:putative photosynthetic complex assembly protein